MISLEAVYIKNSRDTNQIIMLIATFQWNYEVASNKHTNIDVKLYDTFIIHQDSGKLTMSRNASRSRTIPATLVTMLS